MVHHADYLDHRAGHSLCGLAFENADTLTQKGAADAVCPDCEAKLIEYHLRWWRETALAASAELEALRRKHGEDSAAAKDRALVEEQQRPSSIEESDIEPKTFLEHARRELAELCRQFDGAVPYFRLKNAMQAFSDRLETHERALLAQEIGGDGTLIRWSTLEVEALGWHVTNSPVQGDSDAQWDAWIEDSYQATKKTKRRLGRFR